MAKLHLHPVGVGLILLGLASWLIALGGLAASTKFCNDNHSFRECSQKYQQEWWSIFFELILLVAMLGTCFINVFQRVRYVYLIYLMMVTALLTLTTRTFTTSSYQYVQGSLTINWQDYKGDAYNVAAAGSCMLCIINYALMIFIGHGMAKSQQPQQAGFQAVGVTAMSGQPADM